jgi:hypothetical protein
VSDFTEDGIGDIASAHYTSNNFSIGVCNGAGGFANPTTGSTGTNPYHVSAADFNGDGFEDLLFSNSGSNTITKRSGTGTASFAVASTVITGSSPQNTAVGDFNGDGVFDIASAFNVGNFIGLSLGIKNPFSVKGNGNIIQDESTIPSTTNNTNFGQIIQGSQVTLTFTISNSIATPVNITSVIIDGINQTDFTVTGISFPYNLAAGTTKSFNVIYTASSIGLSTARVKIINDYCMTANYTFAIEGTGICPIEICFNNIDDDCDGQVDENCLITLELKTFIEGYYISNELMHAAVDPINYPDLCDTIIVKLNNESFPFNTQFVDTALLDIFGFANVEFSGSAFGGSYYISIHHRNSIETWSSNPVYFNSSLINFSFADSIYAAYGSNMNQFPDGKCGIWSGDITDSFRISGSKDGLINNNDLLNMEPAVINAIEGYTIEDLTGDRLVEGHDYSIIQNNIFYGISVMRP